VLLSQEGFLLDRLTSNFWNAASMAFFSWLNLPAVSHFCAKLYDRIWKWMIISLRPSSCTHITYFASSILSLKTEHVVYQFPQFQNSSEHCTKHQRVHLPKQQFLWVQTTALVCIWNLYSVHSYKTSVTATSHTILMSKFMLNSNDGFKFCVPQQGLSMLSTIW
jgi:hypothetical protein